MFARGVLVASFLVGTAALGTIYQAPPHDVALAQEADADLVATVEALQTQVAEQDERIDSLEEDLKQLETVLAQVIIDSANSGASGASKTSSQEEHTITGSVELGSNGSGNSFDDNYSVIKVGGYEYCVGQDGFADLELDAQVVIMDGAGSTIAKGATGRGKPLSSSCEFPFTVRNVPDSDFYSITIGRREGPTYSREEMEQMNWNIALSIG